MAHTHSNSIHHATPDVAASAGQAEILDLDAEVLAEYTTAIAAWLPVQAAPRSIVDLGSGTGAGTFTLLAHFPDAHVTAVDSSVEHLRRLRDKACATGMLERVDTVAADLDAAEWPDLGAPDLVWASAAMHHIADPVQALGKVHDALEPGGLFAVVELAGLPRFLPVTAPADRPGLEERCHATTAHFDAEHVPHRGADWGPMLTSAGFTVDGVRTFTVNIAGSRTSAVGRYALAALQRLRHSVAGAVATEDLAALDRLLDIDSPHNILRRDDLALRTERTVWVARRAS
ncbi:class I SAM-dependent methyltransferase [Nocardia sp. NBC_00508]|uniref:class I SAM-dependent methyltransferase n=1 Tax=Nocardia sp. NBC_00508 TaxID=2975992 RepID=UPI002E8179AD|nr:class I SAM-dependent methyltransferase [Nocardia sp. NBC_00508]WUD68527.1 class I SAM-dependent methyltransferase [Nocardia sp. NBC_00508]